MSLPELRTVDELGADLLPGWDAKRRRRWIYRQVEERGMPSIKLGRQLLLDTAAVSRWLDAQRCGDNQHHQDNEWSPETAEAAPHGRPPTNPTPPIPV